MAGYVRYDACPGDCGRMINESTYSPPGDIVHPLDYNVLKIAVIAQAFRSRIREDIILRLKFSQMLEISAQGYIMITPCDYLPSPMDIYYMNLRYIGNKYWDDVIRVGTDVWYYLRNTRQLSTEGWCWYRATMLGLDRPYVSIG